MQVIQLEPEEVEYLNDILENWIDGMEETLRATETDRSLNKPEDMLQLLDGVHTMFDRATTIRMKLKEAMGNDDTSDLRTL